MSNNGVPVIYFNEKTECSVYVPKDTSIASDIKYHVFLSKPATRQLANYIMNEDWGKDNILLYKYLDYIWRFQLIDKMVKKFTYKGNDYLVFHTGLHKRDNNDDVYLVLIPNYIHNFDSKAFQQPWRVAFTFASDYKDNRSFVSKQELIWRYNLDENDLPKKTAFVKNKKDAIFHKNYSFNIDLSERVRTAKQRIIQTLKSDINFDGTITLQDLMKKIDKATKYSIYLAKKDGNIIGKQVFIERKLINDKKITYGYHLELLLPLTLNIDGKYVYFAMVLRPNHKKKYYDGMSIITREMAYCNSRLISQVQLPWLKPFVNTNVPIINDNITVHSDNASYNNISLHNSLANTDVNTVNTGTIASLISPRHIDVTTPFDNSTNNTSHKNVLPFPAVNNNTCQLTLPSNVMVINDGNNNCNKNNNVDQLFNNNPFFYLATVLPLTLPKLRINAQN